MLAAIHVLLSMLTMLYSLLVMGSCSLVQPVLPAALPQENIPQQNNTVTLTVLSARPEIAQALQEAADLFLTNRRGTPAEISVRSVENENSYRAALRARLVAGESADLFHIFGRQDAVELLPHLAPLDSLGWAADTFPLLLEPVTLDGTLYGVPYSVEGVGLLVNKEMLDAAGIDIGDFATLDGMEEAFRTLREKITLGELAEQFPALEAVTEFPVQDYAFAGGQLADVALAGEFASPALAVSAGSVRFARESTMGRYVDLTARYATHGRPWNTLTQISGQRQVEDGIAAGRVAVIQQSTAVYGRVRAIDPELARKLRLLPIPLAHSDSEDAEIEEETVDTVPGKILAEAPAYWAVNANASPAVQRLAREFLTWLYQSEAGASLYAGRMEALSPYRETARDTDNPLHGQLLGYLEQDMALPRLYREFPADWAYRSFAEAIRDYVTIPALTWEEAAAAVRESWAR